jgi:hypothetical protein
MEGQGDGRVRRVPRQVKGLRAIAKGLGAVADMPSLVPLVTAFLRDYAALVEQAADSMLKLHVDLKAERQKNKELRQLCHDMAVVIKSDDDTFRRLREISEQELHHDFIGEYDDSLGTLDQLPLFDARIRKLRVRGIGK